MRCTAIVDLTNPPMKTEAQTSAGEIAKEITMDRSPNHHFGTALPGGQRFGRVAVIVLGIALVAGVFLSLAPAAADALGSSSGTNGASTLILDQTDQIAWKRNGGG